MIRERFEWYYDIQQKDIPLRKYIELTPDTKFYECEYTRNGICDADGSEYAIEAFLSSDMYKNGCNKIPTDIECIEALACDFDRDGKEEKAYLLKLSPLLKKDISDGGPVPPEVSDFYSVISPNSCTVSVMRNSRGEYTVSDYLYAVNAQLYELRYNGFSHLVISGGVSNNSSCADFFSLSDGIFELELREFNAYGTMDGIFLAQSMAQASGMWLIFWNEDNSCYVTPQASYMKKEQTAERFSANEYSTVIGNSVYSFFSDCKSSYILTADGAETAVNRIKEPLNKLSLYGISERSVAYGREFYIPYVKNFDYETALKNVIPLK